MSDRPRRIIVVDPSLRDNVGHHIEYDLSLVQGAEDQGLEAVVLAHKDSARLLPPNACIIPAFSEDMWGLWRSPTDSDVRRSVILHKLLLVPIIPSLLQGIVLALRRGKTAVNAFLARGSRTPISAGPVHRLLPPAPGARSLVSAARAFCNRLPGIRSLSFLVLVNPRFHFELRKALRRIGFNERDLVFCHTATHHQLLEWSFFAASQPAAPRYPRVVLLLRYPPMFYHPSLPHFKLAFRLLERAFKAGKVRMATDSERLADEFAPYTSIPFEILPIPHTRAHSLAVKSNGRRRKRICFASLGNARAEKGIVEILDAIRLLHSTYNLREDIEFFLQLNDPDKGCAAHVRSFLEQPPANVRFSQTALSPDEYRSILAEVDVVLVPYWGDVYASRTSGIFLEAVAAGKPVIVTADTWMTDELREHGSAVAIPSRSSKALADAIIDIHKNFDSYRARAVASACSCVRRHSPKSLLQKLVAAGLPQSSSHRRVRA